MRIHKRIIVNQEEMEKVLPCEELIRKATKLIEEYNNDKALQISYGFSGNSNRINNYGYWDLLDKYRLDDYFVGILGMKDIEKRDWDNKSAMKYYFFEE